MNTVFSYWEMNRFDEPIDFTIIGSGFTGLSAAIHLKMTYPRKRVVIMERGVLPYGASTKNAGFACFGSISELEDDRTHMSDQEILDTVRMRYDGLLTLRSLVNDGHMQYNSCGGVEVYDSKVQFDEAYAQMAFWNDALHDITGGLTFKVIENSLPHFYPKAIKNRYEGALHPAHAIHSLWALAQKLGVEFLCATELKSFEEHTDFVNLNSSLHIPIKTKQLLLCTNAFTENLLPDLDIKPARNQVLITKPLAINPLDSCYHFNKGYVYFRAIHDRILLGGARHISTQENTAAYGNTDEIQQYLTTFLAQHIAPEAEIEHWWSGIIATGAAKKPLISKRSDKISFGLRLSGMGVAIGTLVGKRLAELHIE